jgi:hypothetical protein
MQTLIISNIADETENKLVLAFIKGVNAALLSCDKGGFTLDVYSNTGSAIEIRNAHSDDAEIFYDFAKENGLKIN